MATKAAVLFPLLPGTMSVAGAEEEDCRPGKSSAIRTRNSSGSRRRRGRTLPRRTPLPCRHFNGGKSPLFLLLE
ncbi:MAG: hypothetical protein BJ554DRAFT_5925 [Olpidium bornovanus]|uniref:Uncharacterized protein n=1 Tax=Olpidium bornovanus TaxID=278681 RepID=A0A8H8DKM6_9FUNG|nr:MAG: hypothetical protein BJ554DRAFT_5925 [Olpidium bornovanus]